MKPFDWRHAPYVVVRRDDTETETFFKPVHYCKSEEAANRLVEAYRSKGDKRFSVRKPKYD